MARAEITGRRPLVTGRGRAKHKIPKANSPIIEPDPDAIEPRRQRGPGASATTCTPPIRGPPIAPLAFTIEQFCQLHQLSQSMYFKMREQGLGPQEMQYGRRRAISYEAAEHWRRERERAAAMEATE